MDTKIYQLPDPNGAVSTGQYPKIYVVHLCNLCKTALRGKPVSFNFYRGGRCGFVNEIWINKEGTSGNH